MAPAWSSAPGNEHADPEGGPGGCGCNLRYAADQPEMVVIRAYHGVVGHYVLDLAASSDEALIMMIRTLLLAVVIPVCLPAYAQQGPPLAAILDEAAQLEPLETVMVAVDGELIAERGYAGHSVDTPTNIKSASKTIVSALVGMAIDRGVLDGVDQPIADFLADDFPENPDPRLEQITIGNLLSMQAGLTPTSGPNYGRWVASGNWVRAALDQPFANDPGGSMLY